MDKLCKAAVGAALLSVIAGCSSQPATPDAWTRWVCDSQAEALWRFTDDSKESVDVRVAGGDIAHRLKREPSGSGAMFSDGMLTFHMKGEEGLIYRTASNDLIGRGCKAP